MSQRENFSRPDERTRFESKFRVTPGCWLWEAGKSTAGYGRFRREGCGQAVMAHRLSYELYIGEIPAGLVVLHACDNPRCVNPHHLSVGSHRDNVLDRVSKKRSFRPIGQLHPHSVLTEEQATAIYLDGRKQRLIAADYGIRANHVSQIKTGKLWPHVAAAVRKQMSIRAVA